MKPKGSQFTQLPMFMPAGDLADPSRVVPAEADLGYDPASLREDKIEESRAPGSSVDTQEPQAGASSLRASVAAHGVREPVSLSLEPDPEDIEGSGPHSMWLFDGHHRVYTAADINPRMEVPVSFEDNLGIVRTENGRDFTRHVDQKDPWERS